MDTSLRRLRGSAVALLVLAAAACAALGCGGGGDNGQAASPSLLSTPVASHCGGRTDLDTFCSNGNQCCGAFCVGAGGLCCEVPEGFPNAGELFTCARNQVCCGPGCIHKESPCT